MPRAGKLGFRVLPVPARPSPDLIKRFNGLASSNVADAMGRFRFMDPGMQSRTGMPMCGPAITALCRPGDNLMVHKAIDVAEPGDVIVVNTCGNLTSAVFGELMGRAAVAKGIAGIVVDGAIRDVEHLTALGLPAVSRSVCPGSCDKDGPGEINVAISCGGTVVAPGDIVVADADGIAVVPNNHAEEVLSLVTALVERETQRVREIDSGQITRPDVDEVLRQKGAIT